MTVTPTRLVASVIAPVIAVDVELDGTYLGGLEAWAAVRLSSGDGQGSAELTVTLTGAPSDDMWPALERVWSALRDHDVPPVTPVEWAQVDDGVIDITVMVPAAL